MIKMMLIVGTILASATAFAQADLQVIHGNGGSSGASTLTNVLPPAKGLAGNSLIDVCTDVVTCSSFIATAPAGSNGAQVSHVTAAPSGVLNQQCINSLDCDTFLGK